MTRTNVVLGREGERKDGSAGGDLVQERLGGGGELKEAAQRDEDEPLRSVPDQRQGGYRGEMNSRRRRPARRLLRQRASRRRARKRDACPPRCATKRTRAKSQRPKASNGPRRKRANERHVSERLESNQSVGVPQIDDRIHSSRGDIPARRKRGIIAARQLSRPQWRLRERRKSWPGLTSQTCPPPAR